MSSPTGKKKQLKTHTIKVENLARVEGEGGLFVKIKNKRVTEVKLKIFEPPRFFEAFLQGRDYSEAPDITARICGICPIAYQMSASQAMEDALGVTVNGPLRDLRRLIYCGEWIQSHVLHIFMLHAPDFLGYESAIHLAKDYPDIVQNALKLKKIGNEIMALLGGREVHPVNLKVGGFYKIPSQKQFQDLLENLKWGRDKSAEMLEVIAGFRYPDFEQNYEFVALQHPGEYPITEGRLVSNRGLDIDIREYEDYFEEIHVAHSNALHSVLKERGAYFVGPLARFNLNFERLSPLARELAEKIGLTPPCNNPFKSILVRMIETLYAYDEAIRIIENLKMPVQAATPIKVKAGTGCGCTEAPRGICWHKYSLDGAGIIQKSRIVPPTSQNQKTIENDLYHYVEKYRHLPKDELTWQCEQAIRNYDPCISCATHFLKLEIERE
jgi:coenzyme F420-reducing hydrogenase alpha subunit